MKKLVLSAIVIALLGSCSLFDKPGMTQEEIDALIAEKQELEKELQENKAQYEQELMQMKQQMEEAKKLAEEEQQPHAKKGTGKYYVIVGSFKTPAYAEDYAEKMRLMGSDGDIIQGPSNFRLVTHSSHNSLRAAANAMEQARVNISSEAWVYRD